MTPDKTSRIVITKMPKTVREMNSYMLRHILSDTHAVRATLALQSNLFMQNRHLIVLIALHSNCHDCKKKKNEAIFLAPFDGFDEIVLYSPL